MKLFIPRPNNVFTLLAPWTFECDDNFLPANGSVNQGTVKMATLNPGSKIRFIGFHRLVPQNPKSMMGAKFTHNGCRFWVTFDVANQIEVESSQHPAFEGYSVWQRRFDGWVEIEGCRVKSNKEAIKVAVDMCHKGDTQVRRQLGENSMEILTIPKGGFA